MILVDNRGGDKYSDCLFSCTTAQLGMCSRGPECQGSQSTQSLGREITTATCWLFTVRFYQSSSASKWHVLLDVHHTLLSSYFVKDIGRGDSRLTEGFIFISSGDSCACLDTLRTDHYLKDPQQETPPQTTPLRCVPGLLLLREVNSSLLSSLRLLVALDDLV
jgi:hypothetical protein